MILTPPQTHQAITTDCLRASAYAICEKPVATTYKDFQDLWQILRECDRVYELSNGQLKQLGTYSKVTALK